MLARWILSMVVGLSAALPTAAALPVAEAGRQEFATRYVAVGRSVTLDGSRSYGRSCDLVYAWTLVARPVGSSSSLANPGSATPTFVPDVAGDYEIALVVSDDGGISDPARVTVSAITHETPYPLPVKNADRWMTLTPQLMDRALPQITLPGTHDSGAYWLDRNARGPDFEVWSEDWEWLVTDEVENEVAHDIARAHDQNLLEQLNGGIRYFDLRVTHRAGEFYVYHGLLGRPLTTVLSDIQAFMQRSEHEFVTVGVSHMATGTNSGNKQAFLPEHHERLMELLVDQLGPYLYQRNGRTVYDLRATTLRQIVDDGPKVLLVYSDDYFWRKNAAGEWEFGPGANLPHAEKFWHQGFTTGGGYTNTVNMHDSWPCPRNDDMKPRGQFDDQLCNATQFAATGSQGGFTLFQTLTANDFIAKNSACAHLWTCPDWTRPGPKTLLELSRTVNPHLPSMLDAMSFLRPNVILADFYEESAVVSEAIRLNQVDLTVPTARATRNPPANRYGGSFGDVTVTLTGSDEAGGSGVAGIVYALSGAQSAGLAEYCGAEAQVVVKAKGTTTITYHAVDRAGHAGADQTLVLRLDQQCDFNRDGKVDATDHRGLLNSLFDRNSLVVGDLDPDGRLTSQEWVRCFNAIHPTSR